MNYKNRRLLFSSDPYGDESFIGYVMRLAELNDVPDIRWIFQFIRLGKFREYNFRYSFDFNVNTVSFSQLAGVDVNDISKLLYFHEFGLTRHIAGNLIVFNQPIRHDLICRENPKICPRCLSEANYCRKVWEIALVTVCPIHQCLLLDYCPNCQSRLDWTRPKVNLCHCQFDFRESKVTSSAEKELRLSKYLHQIFHPPIGDEDFNFNYPLIALSSDKLLKLMCFMLAYHCNYWDYTGENLARYMNNESIHRAMYFALEVFDNWASNYHGFIEAWIDQYKNFINIENPPYSPCFQLPSDYSQYESFNYVLREYFGKREFPFLYKAYVNFLKNLPIISPNSYELDYL